MGVDAWKSPNPLKVQFFESGGLGGDSAHNVDLKVPKNQQLIDFTPSHS
ncbi:MAG: hypothetical protein AAF492_27940 [Verrucomicrobiota bacterium]